MSSPNNSVTQPEARSPSNDKESITFVCPLNEECMERGDDGATKEVRAKRSLIEALPALRANFSHDTTESASGRIEIKDFPAPVIEIMLCFLSETAASGAAAVPLLGRSIDEFSTTEDDVTAIKQARKAFIEQHITSEYAQLLLQCADKYEIPLLKRCAESCFVRRFDADSDLVLADLIRLHGFASSCTAARLCAQVVARLRLVIDASLVHHPPDTEFLSIFRQLVDARADDPLKMLAHLFSAFAQEALLGGPCECEKDSGVECEIMSAREHVLFRLQSCHSEEFSRLVISALYRDVIGGTVPPSAAASKAGIELYNEKRLDMLQQLKECATPAQYELFHQQELLMARQVAIHVSVMREVQNDAPSTSSATSSTPARMLAEWRERHVGKTLECGRYALGSYGAFDAVVEFSSQTDFASSECKFKEFFIGIECRRRRDATQPTKVLLLGYDDRTKRSHEDFSHSSLAFDYPVAELLDIAGFDLSANQLPDEPLHLVMMNRSALHDARRLGRRIPPWLFGTMPTSGLWRQVSVGKFLKRYERVESCMTEKPAYCR